jgi:serine/threonine protein phosphatase 1
MIALHPAPGRLPAGRRIYAVGDVHGCDRKLRAIHAAIAADFTARPISHATLLHIGDYIDRGPDSARVVARILRRVPAPGLKTVHLMGNHEHMMLSALSDPGMAALWLHNGGDAALRSWKVIPATPPEEWAALIPAAHLSFIAGLPLRHEAGSYLFVHAGIRPGVPLPDQSEHDLLWIREPFLSSTLPFGAVVVHGHTPGPDPVVRANRVGIDTGAVAGGPLTCAVFEADRLGFIQV